MLQSAAARGQAAPGTLAVIEKPSTAFTGGVHVDWLAASTSLMLMLFVIALSFQRILGLDERFLAFVQDARTQRLARKHETIEQARRSLEAQFQKEE